VLRFRDVLSQISDPDPRIFLSRIPDLGSYILKGGSISKPQIYTYSRYWIAVNNLVRAMEAPLTRTTNADFAHHYGI
jgi:hypothetical protein